jgi:hypothetical protein
MTRTRIALDLYVFIRVIRGRHSFLHLPRTAIITLSANIFVAAVPEGSAIAEGDFSWPNP